MWNNVGLAHDGALRNEEAQREGILYVLRITRWNTIHSLLVVNNEGRLLGSVDAYRTMN